MRILFASSEVAPYSRTGEQAENVAALAAAIQRHGHEVTLISPRYRNIEVAKYDLRRKRFKLVISIRGRPVHGGLLEGATPQGVPILFVDQPGFFERAGIYGDGPGQYADNDERFAFFCHAVLDSCRYLGFSPDIIHLNDWACGPVAALLQHTYRDRPELNATGTVFTVHNLDQPISFPPEAMMSLGLSWNLFTPSTLEYFGKVSFLKAGLVFADKLAVLSPAYARAIQEPDHGSGFDAVLRERAADLKGILLGVDPHHFDPATDTLLPHPFSATDTGPKEACKIDLQRRLGLPESREVALLGWAGPLDQAHGADLLLEVMPDLLRMDCQIAIAGAGEPDMATSLQALADQSPHRLAFTRESDAELTRRLCAGLDAILLPTRLDPSGLQSIQATRFGAVPIALARGGLDDVIEDAADGEGTGFKFHEPTGAAFLQAIQRALGLYADRPAWRRMVEAVMSLNFSWDHAARRYEALYREVSALRR